MSILCSTWSYSIDFILLHLFFHFIYNCHNFPLYWYTHTIHRICSLIRSENVNKNITYLVSIETHRIKNNNDNNDGDLKKTATFFISLHQFGQKWSFEQMWNTRDYFRGLENNWSEINFLFLLFLRIQLALKPALWSF